MDETWNRERVLNTRTVYISTIPVGGGMCRWLAFTLTEAIMQKLEETVAALGDSLVLLDWLRVESCHNIESPGGWSARVENGRLYFKWIEDGTGLERESVGVKLTELRQGLTGLPSVGDTCITTESEMFFCYLPEVFRQYVLATREM